LLVFRSANRPASLAQRQYDPPRGHSARRQRRLGRRRTAPPCWAVVGAPPPGAKQTGDHRAAGSAPAFASAAPSPSKGSTKVEILSPAPQRRARLHLALCPRPAISAQI